MQIRKAERDSQKLRPQTLRVFRRQLETEGYLILDEVIASALVKKLGGSARKTLSKHISKALTQNPIPPIHLDAQIPPEGIFLHPHLCTHPMVMQILSALGMGDDFYLWFMHANTAFPGAGRQGIHRDLPHLFPELKGAIPGTSYVVSIPLDDFTMQNGATELWPGSHLIQDPDRKVRSSFSESAKIAKNPLHPIAKNFEARAKKLKSIRAIMKAGSILVRDMRLWHRAMPNQTSRPRTMLTLGYNRAFLALYPSQTISRVSYRKASTAQRDILRHMQSI